MRARTHQQLKLVCSHLGVDASILDPLLPETVIHYCGHAFDAGRPLDAAGERHMLEQMERLIAEKHCAIAYG